MTGLLDGKVAIVTGAGGGIGAVYARALGEAGSSVVLADLNEERASAVAKALREDGLSAEAVQVDISDPASARGMVESAVRSFGGVDILVNNAALMAELPRLPLVDYPVDWWQKVLDVNVSGALYCTQAAYPEMVKRGGGKVINQSSAGAFDRSGAYSVSKLAVVGLTTVLAKNLGQYNITVNAIAPGMIGTEAGNLASASGELEAKLRTITPLPHRGQATDLVGALLFLASSASDWVTGQTLSVDGGWIMRP